MNAIIVTALKHSLGAKESEINLALNLTSGDKGTPRERLAARLEHLQRLAADHDAIRDELAKQEAAMHDATPAGSHTEGRV